MAEKWTPPAVKLDEVLQLYSDTPPTIEIRGKATQLQSGLEYLEHQRGPNGPFYGLDYLTIQRRRAEMAKVGLEPPQTAFAELCASRGIDPHSSTITVREVLASEADAVLLPFIIESEIRAAQLMSPILQRLVRRIDTVAALEGRNIRLLTTREGRSLKPIGEGEDLPLMTFTSDTGLWKLSKMGARVRRTEEQIELMPISLFRDYMAQVARQHVIDWTSEIIRACLFGDVGFGTVDAYVTNLNDNQTIQVATSGSIAKVDLLNFLDPPNANAAQTQAAFEGNLLISSRTPRIQWKSLVYDLKAAVFGQALDPDPPPYAKWDDPRAWTDGTTDMSDRILQLDSRWAVRALTRGPVRIDLSPLLEGVHKDTWIRVWVGRVIDYADAIWTLDTEYGS